MSHRIAQVESVSNGLLRVPKNWSEHNVSNFGYLQATNGHSISSSRHNLLGLCSLGNCEVVAGAGVTTVVGEAVNNDGSVFFESLVFCEQALVDAKRAEINNITVAYLKYLLKVAARAF